MSWQLDVDGMPRVPREDYAPGQITFPPRSNLTDIWVWIGSAEEPRFDWLTFEPGTVAGRVPCHECGGSGWWGFGPEEAHGPCVDCKGTGREWVGL